MTTPLRGMIFDCDGVLIDSRQANMTYYNRLLAEVGRPPMTPKQEDFVHMASERQAVEHILTPEEFARYYELAAKIPYRELVLPMLELEPGVREVLDWLHGCGIRLAVHTNRGKGMWHVLDKFDMRELFDPVMTVELVAAKPSPEGVERIVEAWGFERGAIAFVGDSRTDAEAAAGGGVHFVAYKNPALAGACAHVSGFTELRRLLEQGGANCACRLGTINR